MISHTKLVLENINLADALNEQREIVKHLEDEKQKLQSEIDFLVGTPTIGEIQLKRTNEIQTNTISSLKKEIDRLVGACNAGVLARRGETAALLGELASQSETILELRKQLPDKTPGPAEKPLSDHCYGVEFWLKGSAQDEIEKQKSEINRQGVVIDIQHGTIVELRRKNDHLHGFLDNAEKRVGEALFISDTVVKERDAALNSLAELRDKLKDLWVG